MLYPLSYEGADVNIWLTCLEVYTARGVSAGRDLEDDNINLPRVRVMETRCNGRMIDLWGAPRGSNP